MNNFNRSQFFLALSSFNEETFFVRAFHSIDDGISSHYHFLIEVITVKHILPEKFVNQKATLYWENYRHGIIATAHDLGKQKEGYCYELEFVSMLHPLLMTTHSRVFVNKTLSEIISEILKIDEINLFKFNIQKDILIPYRVQYLETDFDFFNSLIEEYEWSWIFDHSDKTSRLLIIDNLNQINNSVKEIENINNTLIKIEKNFFNEILYIETEKRVLMPGHIIRFQDKNYRILNISHDGSQKIESYLNPKLRYIAKLELISPQIKLYSLNSNQMVKKNTPLLTAVTVSDSDYPELDPSGRYRTKLFFSDKDSIPQYLIEPHDGMHFPERAGIEMVVSHIDGNINQPILLGVLNNAETITPITSKNNSQHIYRTDRGNQLLIEDKKGENQIQINNPEQKNVLLLDATQDKNRVQLQSEEGRIQITSGKNVFSKSQSSHYQRSKNQKILIEKDQKLQATDNIQLKSGDSASLSAKNNLLLKSNSQNIIIQGKRQAEITSNNNLTLQNQSGKIILKSTQNNIQIVSNKSIWLNTKQNASLSSGESSVSLNSGGLSFNTAQLKVNANKISCPNPTPGSSSSLLKNIDDSIEVENMMSKPDIPVPFIPLAGQPQYNEDDNFKLFVATVYGEAGSIQSAWEPVADTIMTRAENKKQNVRSVITRPGQFSCYTNPNDIDWNNTSENKSLFWNEHGEFLKAWAYLNNKNINENVPVNQAESIIIENLQSQLRPYYEGQVKYKINYYYSPEAQMAMHKQYPERYKVEPQFLEGLQNPDQYQVYVPDVNEDKFKFYFIPPNAE